MSSLFDLTGKTALVTGASRGMGFEMASALADHGARVVVSARNQDGLDEAATAINAAVGEERAFGVSCHIGDSAQLEKLVERARELAGPIDVLVGNAGVNSHFGSSLEIDGNEYSRTMELNVQSNLTLTKLVLPQMESRGCGSVMFTSSIAAFRPSPFLGTYGTSKLALIGLTRNLALELGPKRIRVNAICPGVIRTEFSRALWDNPEISPQALGEIPMGRFGEPEDFRGIAVYLASDASQFMTGQALTVCGGASMWS